MHKGPSVAGEKGKEWMQEALTQIDPVSANVLAWNYSECHSFAEITIMLNRSISIVRNHHNWGIFELQQ